MRELHFKLSFVIEIMDVILSQIVQTFYYCQLLMTTLRKPFTVHMCLQSLNQLGHK